MVSRECILYLGETEAETKMKAIVFFIAAPSNKDYGLTRIA